MTRLTAIVCCIIAAAGILIAEALRATPAVAAEPTVVRELVKERTTYATTYELSNGQRRVVFSQVPVHFQDEKGDWQKIDPTLEAIADGAYATKAAPVEVEIAPQAENRAPLQLTTGEYEVSLDLLDAVESDLTVGELRASFPGVATATDLRYEPTGDGLKETLVLRSSDAPSTFTFRLTHEGLTLRRDDADGWGLYEPDGKEPVLLIGELLVWDSSSDESDVPAYCNEAEMKVEPGSGASTFTYQIPSEWLADEERLYPIFVDPNLFTRNPTDVYISYGYPDTCYGTSQDLFIGKVSTATDICKSLVKFPQVENPNNIPTGSVISAATFSIRQYWEASSDKAVKCDRVTNDSTLWGEAATWNNVTVSGTATREDPPSGAADWLEFDCQADVQGWVDEDFANKGFMLRAGSSYSSYAHKCRSGEYSDADYRPKLSVDYDPPVVTSTAQGQVTGHLRIGDEVTVELATDDVSEVGMIDQLRLGINRVDANNDDMPIDDRRGVMGWFASTPPAGWTYQPATGGGYVAFFPGETYGSDHIAPLLDDCDYDAVNGIATLVFRVDDNYGDQQVNDFDTFIKCVADANSWESGWVDDADDPVDLLPKPIDELSCETAAGEWSVDVDRDSDGLPDTGSDHNGAGRGDVDLSWDACPVADGYRIYCYDGGAYQQVGEVRGNQTTSWSSAGAGLFPRDSLILSWQADGYGGNPYVGAATPDDPRQEELLQPTNLAGSGVVVSDGRYLYVRRRGSYSGPTLWTRVEIGDPQSPDYGTLAGTLGPDYSAQSIFSAFLLDGFLYGGYARLEGGTAYLDGVWKGAAGQSQTSALALAQPPLDRGSGSAVAASSGNIMVAADEQHIYSAARISGVGYKVRCYERDGSSPADHDIALPDATAALSGLISDGSALYFFEWTAANGAFITKVSTSSWEIVNRWPIDQGDTELVGGCYDPVENVFWCGSLDEGDLYRYAGPGLDLRDDPHLLYDRTDGDGYDTAHNYWFRVVPYNDSSGEVGLYDNDAALPSLPDRTARVEDAPQHTSHELGEFAGHLAEALLDEGSLRLTTTDLAIATWGPPAALVRSYSSEGTGGCFAPGWRFSFEANLDFVSGTVTDFYDLDGERYRFASEGGAWRAPNGLRAELIELASPERWELRFDDRTVLSFDADGTLTGQSDRNGNQTSYVWSAGDLTITAANNQTITVDFDAQGKIDSASYVVGSQARRIDYATGTDSGQVTYFWKNAQDPDPQTPHPESYTVEYGYAAATARLTSLAIDDVSLSVGGTPQDLEQSFAYNGSEQLSEVRFADWADETPDSDRDDARAEITYGSTAERQASVTRYGRIDDTRGSRIIESYHWNPAGTTAWQRGPSSPDASPAETASDYQWDYAYTLDNRLASELAPAAAAGQSRGECRWVYDARGNLLAEIDEAGSRTSYAYELDEAADPDIEDLLIRTADAGGSTTYDSYDADGDLTVEEQVIEADGTRSRSEYSYDSAGRLTFERHKIANSEWAESDYDADGYALCGEPLTVAQLGVKLSSEGTPQQLEVHRTYDGFGNLLTTTEQHLSSAADPVVLVESSYDLAGRVTAVEAAAVAGSGQMTEHHLFNVLGCELETYLTNTEESGVKGHWQKYTCDAVGRVVTAELYLSGETEPSEEEESTYDGAGRLVRSSTDAELQKARTDYDARGQATSSWGEGLDGYASADALRISYDRLSRQTGEMEKGESQPVVTTYGPTGLVTLEQEPDMSSLAYGYDEAGNITSRTVSDGDDGYEDHYRLDPAGGVVRYHEDDPFEYVTYDYDLLGRMESMTPVGESSASITHNSLSWVLSEPDEEGNTVSHSYTPSGQLASETDSSGTLEMDYDDLGRLESRTEPSGITVETGYDGFGHEARTTISVGSDTTVDETTEYDSLGTRTETEDLLSGYSEIWADAGGGRLTKTTDYGSGLSPSVTTTVTSDTDGLLEEQRSTTMTFADQTTVTVTRTIDAVDELGSAVETSVSMQVDQEPEEELAADRSFDESQLERQWGDGFASGADGVDAYTYSGELKTADDVLLDTVDGFAEVDADYTYESESDALDLWESDSPGVAPTSTMSRTIDYDYDANEALEEVVDDLGTTDTSEHVTRSFDTSSGELLEIAKGTTTETEFDWDSQSGRLENEGPPADPDQVDYQYDSDGRLEAVVDDATGAPDVSYGYTDSGQLAELELVDGSLTTTTEYAFDGEKLIQLDATRSDGASWTLTYLYDEEGRPYMAVYRDGTEDPVLFATIVNDEDDVIELVDANGEAFVAYRYDPWGAPVGNELQSGEPIGVETEATTAIDASLAEEIASRQVLRCCSAPYDETTGLTYVQGGHYLSEAGRFVSGESASELRSRSIPDYDGTKVNNVYEAVRVYVEGDPNNEQQSYRLREVYWPNSEKKNEFRNYDQWTGGYDLRPEATKFKWDHPVSLVVRASRQFKLKALTEFVHRKTKYDDWSARLINWATFIGFTKSWGRLYVKSAPSKSYAYTYTTACMKFKPVWTYFDTFYHVRFYGRRHYVTSESQTGETLAMRRSDSCYFVVGTCHIDVNEIAPYGKWPAEWNWFPKPNVGKLRGKKRWLSFGGNGERVENHFANTWEKTFESYGRVQRDSSGAKMKNRDNTAWWYRRRESNRNPRTGEVSVTHYIGPVKWFRTDGKATVLWIPSTAFGFEFE